MQNVNVDIGKLMNLQDNLSKGSKRLLEICKEVDDSISQRTEWDDEQSITFFETWEKEGKDYLSQLSQTTHDMSEYVGKKIEVIREYLSRSID